jgi:hypothetical protein
MEASSRQFGKQARFAEMYGMKDLMHITVCSEEMRDNMEKALTEVMFREIQCTYSRKICRRV